MKDMSINEILGNLSLNDEADNGDRRLEMLESLRVAAANLNRAELKEELSNVSLEALFTCLATDSDKQIEATTDIIRMLMLLLDPRECIDSYSGSMLEGFSHPDTRVKALGITLLNRYIEKMEQEGEAASLIEEYKYQPLLVAVMKLISSEDLTIANMAGDFLIRLSGFPSGEKLLLMSPGPEIFKGMIDEQDGTIKFRIYEVCAKMINESENCCEFLPPQAEKMLVLPLSKEICESIDPLAQMNALEILSTLTETHKGRVQLKKINVEEILKQLAADWKKNPLSGLIFPGIIKFVGKLGNRSYDNFSKDLLNLVISSILEGNDFSLQTTGFEALCYIRIVSLKDKGVDNCFIKVRDLLREAPMECRCRIITALHHLYPSSDSSLFDKENREKTLARWFFIVFPEISQLFLLVQQPFVEIRLAVLKYFSALCSYDWALQAFLRLAGVLEFLLDRRLEADKGCALAKFKICEVLLEREITKKILSSDKLMQLEVHVKQGPYFAPVQSQVTTDTPS